MLRDLATLIEDLQRGMQAAAGRALSGVRIAKAEMTLPVDTALVLKGSSCTLLADVVAVVVFNRVSRIDPHNITDIKSGRRLGSALQA